MPELARRGKPLISAAHGIGAVMPLEPPHREMAMRDALEVIHEQDIDAWRRQAHRCTGKALAAARSETTMPKRGAISATKPADDRRRGAGDAALEQKRGSVIDEARQQRARGVIADIEPIA